MNWIQRKLFRIFKRKETMLLIDIGLRNIKLKDYGYKGHSLSPKAYEVIFDMPFKKIKELGLVKKE